jgi:hypothetical protein
VTLSQIDPSNAVPPVFFLHIPKTAGSALGQFLHHRFPEGSIHWVSTGAAEREDPSLLRGPRLVTGHVGFEVVPLFPERPRILTFLRDPVERAISNFYFYRQLGIEGMTRHGVGLAYRRVVDLSIREFMEHDPQAAHFILGNAQTRMLAGEHGSEPSLASLDAARKNLAECDFLGLIERIPESMSLLCRTMSWPETDTLPRANATECRPACEELDPSTLHLLQEWTRLDQALYRFAESLFERRLRAVDPSSSTTDHPLPRSAVLTFEQAIPGYGWLPRERTKHGWLCWLENEASLEFRIVPAQAVTLRFLAWFVHPRQHKRLSVTINGRPLVLHSRSTPDGFAFEADVPLQQVQRADCLLKLVFQTSEGLRPCDILRGSTDSRRLGAALLRVDLTPRTVVSNQHEREPALSAFPI